MSRPFQIEARDDFTAAEIEALEDRLYEHNKTAVGRDDGRWIGFTVRGEDGALIAAVAGYTWAGYSEVRQVWVDPAHRRRGWARRLMEAAIAEARARGCETMFLATYDFQAPWLYRALGFTEAARIDGWPPGHANFIMRKDLR
ncbi:MAG TPA: GNAT family N-acetyltransferase [Caulobacteraceae bacterium]|nr:GNAT family N-acetyltransferase [Caulobacteraceae bacterium]